jgi:hypothetical protein
MQTNQVIEMFGTNYRAHPVWLLLGDVEQGMSAAEAMVAKVRHVINYHDSATFELNKSNLQNLNNFLALHSFNLKIAICILRSEDDFLNASILKKIENVPDNTIFILVAQRVPITIYSRSIVFRLPKNMKINENYLKKLEKYPGFDKFLDEIEDYIDLPETIICWLEAKMVSYIENRETRMTNTAYQAWQKCLEIMSWLNSGQTNPTNATEMMLAILEMSLLQSRS